MTLPRVFGRCAGGDKCGRLLFEVSSEGELIVHIYPSPDYHHALAVGMAKAQGGPVPKKDRPAKLLCDFEEVEEIVVSCPDHGRWSVKAEGVRHAITGAIANRHQRCDLTLKPGVPDLPK